MSFELLIEFVGSVPSERQRVKTNVITWLDAIGRSDYVEGVIDGVEILLTDSELSTGETNDERLASSPVALFDDHISASRTLLRRLNEEFAGLIRGRITEISDESWSQCWQENFTPLETNKFFISPLGDPATTPLGKIRIEIGDGYGAFGTGQHATTRAVIDLLESNLEHWGSGSILDVGTGTGIYLLMAGHLGLKTLAGTEISDDLVSVAKENCEIAALQADIRLCERPDFGRVFDVVVANILAPAIHDLMPNLVSHLAPGGHLVLAGFVEKEQGLIVEVARKHGLEVTMSRSVVGWQCLALERLKSVF